jgi:hypothetical protein
MKTWTKGRVDDWYSSAWLDLVTVHDGTKIDDVVWTERCESSDTAFSLITYRSLFPKESPRTFSHFTNQSIAPSRSHSLLPALTRSFPIPQPRCDHHGSKWNIRPGHARASHAQAQLSRADRIYRQPLPTFAGSSTKGN